MSVPTSPADQVNITNLCFVIESGTDIRLVEGLSEHFILSILARKIVGGVEISLPPARTVLMVVGPASRVRFALVVFAHLWRFRREINIVLAQGYGAAALASNLAGRLTGTPTFMLVCSPTEAYYRCRMARPDLGKPFRRHELLGMWTLARINAWIGRRYIVLSRYLANVIKSHGTRRPIHIVPVYGVDTAVFCLPKEPKSVIKAKLGLPTSGALLFFSSRVAPEKDSETLLAAMRSLLDSGRDLWLLHRSGGYRTFLRDAERFGVAERVIATDAVHPYRELPENYHASDLCVQASREEGLGFSPLEALSCGVPVIAAAVGGLKETIIDGMTGWTYPVGDPVVLAKYIAEVLDDPIEAARRAARGRELVCAHYNRQVVFGQLARIVG